MTAVAAGGAAAEAYVAALASLPGIGPVGLRRLLDGIEPDAAWQNVVSGRAVRPVRGAPVGPSWQDAAGRVDVASRWRRWSGAGIGVTWPGRPDWPVALVDDPSPPGALFWRGSLAGLHRPCVAIVGTRRATAEGRRTAATMATELAEAGVCVVSGLALGIDGAAHRGALAAGRPGATIGVAASGVDRPYPARHRDLWEEIAVSGLVLAETPPGQPAQAWRFPARNRIIAGLVSLVVVVESHHRGGSLLTADAAIERGVEVRAVPGPVASPASAGTNQLLWDGPGPVRDAADVLDILGSFVPCRPTPTGSGRRLLHRPAVPASVPGPGEGGSGPVGGPGSGRAAGGLDPRVAAKVQPGLLADPDLLRVLDATGWRPTSFNAIVGAAGTGVGPTAAALDRLAALGLVVEERDWWQRTGSL